MAFKLLRKANITKDEKLLVLTGMSYDNKETLYEEAKKSLKKFKGSDGESGNSGSNIKMEPAFLAANEEALLAAGYTRTRGNNRDIGRDRGEIWMHGRPVRGAAGGDLPCTEFRRQAARGGRYQHTNLGSRVSQPSDRNRKNIYPTGPDGRTKTCKSCGSFRHLLPACRDSTENMAKINIVEDENAVVFTLYNKEELRRLGVDARNCAVLDSACSSTVCEDSWINNYIQSLGTNDRQKVKQKEGQRVFKFAGGTCLKSKDEYSLPAVIAGIEVMIKTDVLRVRYSFVVLADSHEESCHLNGSRKQYCYNHGKRDSFKSHNVRTLLHPDRQV